ncbi:MAG TPA: NAD(P)-dependent oxidoreductase [Coriobacteriia bacterium]|nr:NAD(P)-dependent oxidoreductase [Coriobacteriia bacterium]
MKRILVTGARGYIGAHAVRALVAMGAEVVAVDRPGAARPPADDGALHLEADIFADSSQLLGRTGPVDACLHLAWEAGFVHDAPTHMLRLSDHFRFLDGLAQAGVPQIAVLGTMHEVGYFEGMVTETTPTNPRSLYGVAKNALRDALDLRLNLDPPMSVVF